MKRILALLLLFFSSPIHADSAFLVQKLDEEALRVDEGALQDKELSPCSTFKVPLALMGFDSGVLIDEKTPEWTNDRGMKATPQSWLDVSIIWYSQHLVKKLGKERLQTYMRSFSYGNENIEAKGSPYFWINSSLKITPRAQLKFLKKFYEGKLSVSSQATLMTKKLLFREELKNGWKLYGKTGTGAPLYGPKVGWFIGWVEKGSSVFLYVFVLEQESDIPSYFERKARVIKLLSDHGILD